MRGGEGNQEAMGLVGRNPRRDLMAHKGWRKEARSAVEKLSKKIKKNTCKLNLRGTKEVRLPVKLPTRRWKTTASLEAFFREIRSQTEMLVRE